MARVVDNDGLRLHRRNVQARRRQRRFRLLRRELRREENVNEARSGDVDFAGDAVQRKMLHNLLGQLARLLAQFFATAMMPLAR